MRRVELRTRGQEAKGQLRPRSYRRLYLDEPNTEVQFLGIEKGQDFEFVGAKSREYLEWP